VEACSAGNGRFEIGDDQAEDVDVRIRAGKCAVDVRAKIRLQLTRFIGAEALGGNAGLAGGVPPLVKEGRIVLCALHKQAADIFDAMRRNGFDDAIFGDALARSVGVFDGITAAGVEQAVASPGGPIGNVALLKQGCGDAAQTQVPKNAGARRTSADNDNLGPFHSVPFACLQTHPLRIPLLRAITMAPQA
jgi:hypothetical protein